MGGCKRSTPPAYWHDAETCLDDFQKIEDQIKAGKPHLEIAPYVVEAKVSIDKFERHYDGLGMDTLNRQLQSALDAYLDAFVVDDTIYLAQPILQGSVVEQRLTERYPEIAKVKISGSGEIDRPAALVILRNVAKQRAETARGIMLSAKYTREKDQAGQTPTT
ncbi:MAG TPA: hypothetical protein VFC63_01985 [Blastocatellia bacterium]|nr:hypothetical protein [Blastocatellia bacterium]